MLLLVACIPLRAEPAAPLRLGILPFNSTLALMKTHQPLRLFLQNYLGRPVEIYTAPDYQTYLREQLQGNYDVMITAPHFALMAVDKGYVPLLRYKAKLELILALRNEDNTAGPKDMKGRRIAMANPFAFVSIAGLKWLAESGMRPGRDFTVVEKPTHGAAIAAVAVGDADGAITTTTLLGQLPEDIRKRVRYISTGIRLPHVVTMGHQRLGEAELRRIRQALLAFAAAPEGQAFFKETAYIGFEDSTLDDLAQYKPYVNVLRQMLEVAPRQ